ncbi:MAG: ankyrin repeat domain-containing protein, partial [Candidatus Babeliales bacterium]
MSKKQALTSRLFDAMVDNDIPKVQSILAQGVAINQGERDQTPLMYAAYWGKTEIVKLLLVHNPEINKQDDSGCNALLLALKSLYKQEIIEMLLDAGADVNMPDKDGMTPFLQAASSSDLSLIKLMLKKGAHVHSQSNDGTTALIYAVSRT